MRQAFELRRLSSHFARTPNLDRLDRLEGNCKLLFTSDRSEVRGTGLPFVSRAVTAAMLPFAFASFALAQQSTHLRGWGDNSYGQCSAPIGNFTQVAVGYTHTVAITTNGSLVAWGNNGDGQCNVPFGTFSQISAGETHTVGVRTDGSLAACGNNNYGQRNVPAGAFFKVAAGYYHNTAIRTTGTLVAWGYNSSGQCFVPGGTFSQVAAGGSHCVGIRTDGSLAAWGDNTYKQCSVPSGPFLQVAAGALHCVAIRSDGSLTAWGNNGDGQCSVPAGTYSQIAAGYFHNVACTASGTLVAWGYNAFGQCNVPTGTFSQIGAGYFHAIGVNPWKDCNGNEIFDGDDLTFGGMSDLNLDGILDSCSQGAIEYHQTSPNLGVPTANIAVNHTFTLQAPADVDVVLSIRAVGDLDANTEYLTVKLNGTTAGRLFEVGGVNCSTGNANNGNITISRALFNSFVAGGSLTVTLLPSPAVTGSECGNGSMSVSLNYVGIGATGDCNANGRLDTREIGENPVLDRDRSARLDACEISEDPSRDCNANGEIDSYDIMLGAADDNLNGRIDLCEYAKGDFDLDGEVTTADLSVALLYIGEVDSPIGDLDGDGTVTTADVSLLLLNFGPVTWP